VRKIEKGEEVSRIKRDKKRLQSEIERQEKVGDGKKTFSKWRRKKKRKWEEYGGGGWIEWEKDFWKSQKETDKKGGQK
jgi:hypothetical protein